MGKLPKKRKITPTRYRRSLEHRAEVIAKKRKRDIEKHGFARGFRKSGAI